jgi:hypothetical protein
MSNAPLSEQFRLAAKDWVDKDSAASMLDETKTAVLSQRMAALGDMPVNRAEQIVKASAEWHEWIAGMVNARTTANLAKVKLEWVRMRFSEQQSFEATKRAEMKL